MSIDDSDETSAFGNFMQRLTAISPGEVRQVPIDSLDEDGPAKLERPLLKYADTLIKRMMEIRFPVSDAIFQQHLEDANAQLDETGDESLRDELICHKIDKKPSLHFLQATSAFDNLLIGNDPTKYEKCSDRYDNIQAALMNMASAIWFNEETSAHADVLSALLYDDAQSINVTLSARSADEVTRRVVTLAREVKGEMLGIRR